MRVDTSLTKLAPIICCVVIGVSSANYAFSQPSIQLLSNLPLPSSTFSTDIWGYFDFGTQKEYALITAAEGALFIVDVTNPSSPELISRVYNVGGADVKTLRQYAYTVNGSARGLGSIVDISVPESPRVVGSFPSAHNIFISDNGYMYSTGGGAHITIYDLNGSPTNPRLVWSQPEMPPNPLGYQNTGGHDVSIIGNRLYDFHMYLGVFIYDVTTPANPDLLGKIKNETIFYYHSGWVTDDHQFLFIGDELAYWVTPSLVDISVWDISDVLNPVLVGEFLDDDATVHNIILKDSFAFTSYYSAGFRVFDISDPSDIFIAAEYDTSPITGPGFLMGAWGVYADAPSGNIYVSDQQEGLFVFSFSDGTAVNATPLDSSLPSEIDLHQNYPNPFNPTTTIRFVIPKSSRVRLDVTDLLGRQVATLVDGLVVAGENSFVFDASTLPSGSYIYKLETPEGVFTKTMVLQK